MSVAKGKFIISLIYYKKCFSHDNLEWLGNSLWLLASA
jgi:hypothetical protein